MENKDKEKAKNNIIRLRNKSDNVIDFLDDAKEKVREYNIDNVMLAFKLKEQDGYIMTGYCNLAMAEKQELLGHIQVDIVNDMIRQNYLY